MKNTKLQIILFSLLIPFLIACDCSLSYKMEGKRGASKNIADAKRRGTFITSCRLVQNDIDSLNIREAFIEKGFGYGKTIDETIQLSPSYPFEKYQFTVKIEEGMLDLYYNKFYLALENAKPGDQVDVYSVYCPIDTLFEKDTLNVFVLNKENSKMDTIGMLTFKIDR